MIGGRPGGHMTAMSLRVCEPFEPVLSATRQCGGTHARKQLRPVTLASIHCLN
jgi:hypothetical protein